MSGVCLAAGIEFSFHRLGLADWSPAGVLRHWADAPWQLTPEGIAVACLPLEAVWFGLTNRGAPALVTLSMENEAASRSLRVPPDWQLSAYGPHDQRRPLALGNASVRTFRFEVQRDRQAAELQVLSLMAPAVWIRRFGPLTLDRAERPPPVMAYSRIVRPKSFSPGDPD